MCSLTSSYHFIHSFRPFSEQARWWGKRASLIRQTCIQISVLGPWTALSKSWNLCHKNSVYKLAFWRMRHIQQNRHAHLFPAEASLDQPAASWAPDLCGIPFKASRASWLSTLEARAIQAYTRHDNEPLCLESHGSTNSRGFGGNPVHARTYSKITQLVWTFVKILILFINWGTWHCF